jgi:hypothetical protein
MLPPLAPEGEEVEEAATQAPLLSRTYPEIQAMQRVLLVHWAHCAMAEQVRQVPAER